MINRAYYAAEVAAFLASTDDTVLGSLSRNSEFAIEESQRDAWLSELMVLRVALEGLPDGQLFLEFVVPRLGKRIDAVVLAQNQVFVLEFKVGATQFHRADQDQAWDYALDLKNFHETSRDLVIRPALIITGRNGQLVSAEVPSDDGVYAPALLSSDRLNEWLKRCLATRVQELQPSEVWSQGRYKPTPTIIEAATSLYRRHSVQEIARHDAGATNLTITSAAVADVITTAREQRQKAICFVTGVPGAGKTLVGLDVATRFQDAGKELHSVYLSGNGPLVAILSEALARDKVNQDRSRGLKTSKGEARQAVKAFIQAVHHFRDEGVRDERAPTDHVAIFDEAQRAWNASKTTDFMRRKKGHADFNQSEPEFLISCLDRHPDWAVVVCLVGGGQEINTGEAGIREWLDAVNRSFPHWHVHLSPVLADAEYGAEESIQTLNAIGRIQFNRNLHLSASMRSFRAERVSDFVKLVLDGESAAASELYRTFKRRYPLVLTRSVDRAREWLRTKARGSERFGLVVSSQAVRLKPHAIDVRAPVDPVNWFLNDRTDIRSSFYLEDVATEFQVQGLELDWVGVVWDADFRRSGCEWKHHSFVGDAWQQIRKSERQLYLKNAYRVLLTRARQGMVIVVPEGHEGDHTRQPSFYDDTYEYLRSVGVPELA